MENRVPPIGNTYKIISQIGSGGGGNIFLAEHLRLNKKVVLKADKRKITTHPEVLRREVDALKDLNHTYIPQVHDFFVESETVYTVIDYIEGKSLDKSLKQGEKYSQRQVVRWAKQLLEALRYLHAPTHGSPPRGFVHSDIKPSNIMLTPYNDICLIDFNIALAIGEENVVGRSEGYASPEHYGLDFSFSGGTATWNDTTVVMDNGEDTELISCMSLEPSIKRIVVPDTRSDIYSLGATLYHLLSGKRPAKSAFDVEPLSEREFSPQIVKIIARAMQPNPELRYQTAEEMLYAFENLRENDPRAQLYKRNLQIAIVLLALFFTTGVSSTLIGLKRIEMTKSALVFAEYAQSALEAGDQELAVRYALQSLPLRNSILVPDYIPQAKKALADSLGIYDLADGYKPHRVVNLPSAPFKIAISPDGKTGSAVYAFAVSIFNTETGTIICTLPTVHSALADVQYIDDSTIVYAGEDGLSAYNISQERIIWTGKHATGIAVSADGKVIAGVYRGESFATLYGIDGEEKTEVSFLGKQQKVIENDTFANPNDNIIKLNKDGTWLAVSLAGGALMLYDTTEAYNNVVLFEESEFYHFEGGFNAEYFAFSAMGNSKSSFSVINIDDMVQEGGFESTKRFGAVVNEEGIFLSNSDVVVNVDPATGTQLEVAYTDADVKTFSQCANGMGVTTDANEYVFFDPKARILSRYNSGYANCDFIDIAGDFALVAGRDTPDIRILKRKLYEQAEVLRYDDFDHDESRVNADGTRIMMFGYKGFRIYDGNGNLICYKDIPDAEAVYDQQHSKSSGNLVVIYDNALRIYSGDNGKLINEKTGLKSVFYTKYGISILEQDGTLSLIDIDTARTLFSQKTFGSFAAYCGIVVDDAFLNGRELIGAALIGNDCFFSVSDDTVCSVYNSEGALKFTVPSRRQSEAFYTSSAVIISPLHGTPTAYSLTTGKKIADLEKDSYLTYIKEMNGYVVSEYIMADGRQYAILLDNISYQPLAKLTEFADIMSLNEVMFDYKNGTLRKSRVYTIDELINLASDYVTD